MHRRVDSKTVSPGADDLMSAALVRTVGDVETRMLFAASDAVRTQR